MTQPDHTALPFDLDAPAFLVGVTGYMDIDPNDIDSLKRPVRLIFRLLRHGANYQHPDPDYGGRTLQDVLIDELVPADADETLRKRLRRSYQRVLAGWQGLARTPIVVLSGLAPGADTLVARVALEEEFQGLDFHVRAPLPFPHELYRGASTFAPSSASPEEIDRRQRDYDKLLTDVTPDHTFAVRLAEDRARTATELNDAYLADLGNSARRQRRYRAAGEYLAVTCHLLLAIWNGQREERWAGTAGIVEARLRGPTPGLLPTSSDLALPHGGPVVHLFARRGQTQPAEPAAAVPPRGRTDSLPPIRLLHPFSFAGEDAKKPEGSALESRATGGAGEGLEPIIAAAQHSNADLQQNRLALSCRIAENLESFNADTVTPDSAASEKEFRARLAYSVQEADGKSGTRCIAGDLESASRHFWRALRRISEQRRRAADARTQFGGPAERTVRSMFIATLAAAALLHVFAHWQLSPPDRPAAADAVGEPEAQPPDDLHPHAVSVVRTAAGILAIGLAAFALGYFAVQHPKQLAERSHDYRALAEGLRVQFYWNLAGLGRSVSANYMQRQRSELDWIRGAIRALSLPYEWWRDQFAGLSRPMKLAAMRCVQHGWIEDQRNYFDGHYHEHHHTLHVWHKLGAAAALAGVWSLAVWWCCSWSHGVVTGLESRRGTLLGLSGILILVAAAARVLLFCWSRGSAEHARHTDQRRRRWKQIMKGLRLNRDEQKQPTAAGADRSSGWHGQALAVMKAFASQAAFWSRYLWRQVRPASWKLFLETIDLLVPSLDAVSPVARDYGRRFGRQLLGFAAYLPLSLAVAALANWKALWLGGWPGRLPSAEHWGIILGGLLLLAGALSVAWAEKNLYSELAYQYNTMAALFQNASQHIARDIERLSDERLSDKEFEDRLNATQEFLFSLGKEALDENAEWLLLHRARPLEPVMAG